MSHAVDRDIALLVLQRAGGLVGLALVACRAAKCCAASQAVRVLRLVLSRSRRIGDCGRQGGEWRTGSGVSRHASTCCCMRFAHALMDLSVSASSVAFHASQAWRVRTAENTQPEKLTVRASCPNDGNAVPQAHALPPSSQECRRGFGSMRAARPPTHQPPSAYAAVHHSDGDATKHGGARKRLLNFSITELKACSSHSTSLRSDAATRTSHTGWCCLP
eukprot:355489-Chlamydomonas_euryale.AAC.14